MGRNHGIALQDLAEFLFGHLTQVVGYRAGEVAERVWGDYQRVGRSDRPGFLRTFIGERPIPRRGGGRESDSGAAGAAFVKGLREAAELPWVARSYARWGETDARSCPDSHRAYAKCAEKA